MDDEDPVEILKRNVSNPFNYETFTVTGIMMKYYHTCHRELWFHSNEIEIDRDTNSIKRGTHVDENTFKHSSESIHIGPIAPDMMEDGKIVEVKPSSKMSDASSMQLAYYLWYFKYICDVEKKGVMVYPTEKKREEITLTKELENRVENAIREMYQIVSQESPPEFEEKPFCETCAYKDFCWL